MGTTYFLMKLFRAGTRILEMVLISTLSWKAEMVPIVDVSTVILSTLKVETLPVAL